mmetsp:Transcript_24468/g.31960  ORF Transcript_24468/g.31960 Transcript_24468/m.31960 type:complete len:586 (+) Transcript_24468:53-1810(+)
MCGRARCSLSPDTLLAVANVSSDMWHQKNEYVPRFNAHPGNATPVLVQTSGQRQLHTMTWGLVPSFTRLIPGQKPNFFTMMNARSETVCSKNSFRRLVNRRRCVVIFEGFYEWMEDDNGEKQPYYLHYSDERPMMMAALYDTWRPSYSKGKPQKSSNSIGGGPEEEAIYTYTILTTQASSKIDWLHHRMPVLLEEDQVETWLDADQYQISEILPFLKPYDKPDFSSYPVSKKMNKMSYEEPDCCMPIELKAKSPPPKITQFFTKGKVAKPQPNQQLKIGENLNTGPSLSTKQNVEHHDEQETDDPDLEEAIRRSLEDVQMKSAYIKQESDLFSRSPDPGSPTYFEEISKNELRLKNDVNKMVISSSQDLQNNAMQLVEIISEDILNCSAKYICHQTNCITKGARGLAKAIFEKYPTTNIYKSATKRIPGEVIINDVGNGQQFVVHLFGQDNPGKSRNMKQKSQRLMWFQDCLEKLSCHVNLNPGTVAFPFNIGCGLAGGVWSEYLSAIYKFAESLQDSRVVVCRLEDHLPNHREKEASAKHAVFQGSPSKKQRLSSQGAKRSSGRSKTTQRKNRQSTLQSCWLQK